MVVPQNSGDIEIISGLLLDEAQKIAPDGRWLALGGEALLPGELSRFAGDVEWIPVDVRERDKADGRVVVRDTFDGGSYERVVLPMPPDRELARRWLVTARKALKPGGILILAGANAEGGKSVVSDARRLFGPPLLEHYRQKHRIAQFLAGSDQEEAPSWACADGIVPGTWKSFEIVAAGDTLTLDTMPGVFAGSRLDAGTQLLLDNLEVHPGSRVLDVGCGVGIIGLRASQMGASHVDLVDANLLAIQAASRNLERLGVAGRTVASDVFSSVAGERYDLITSNPPFHRGKQIDYSVADRLIHEAPSHLTPDGRLLIVANAFLAYGKKMEAVFRHVETVASTLQYHVLAAENPR